MTDLAKEAARLEAQARYLLKLAEKLRAYDDGPVDRSELTDEDREAIMQQVAKRVAGG